MHNNCTSAGFSGLLKRVSHKQIPRKFAYIDGNKYVIVGDWRLKIAKYKLIWLAFYKHLNMKKLSRN